MSLFPRFTTGEFTPLFRLLDDYASHQVSRSSVPTLSSTPLRSFQPRFDVKEGKDAYELEGELPGIDQKDVSIEFVDPQTLSIKGRTEHTYESGTRPTAIESQAEQGRITDTTSDTSNGYHKASVEDGDATMSGANPDAAVAKTDEAAVSNEAAPKQPEKPTHKYWVSERSVGEFQRSFNFPARVDQDGVRASLKNGILSILVPKAQAPVSRRINIE